MLSPMGVTASSPAVRCGRSVCRIGYKVAFILLTRFRRAIAVVFLLTLLLEDSGDSAFAHGAYHDLVAQLEDGLASTPANLDLRYQLALAHVEHGEWEAALHEIEHLTRFVPERFETRLISGKALAAAGLLDDALRDLDAYMEIHPGDQPGLVERVRVRLRLGQSEAGCADYLAALTTPATPDIYIEAAEALRCAK